MVYTDVVITVRSVDRRRARDAERRMTKSRTYHGAFVSLPAVVFHTNVLKSFSLFVREYREFFRSRSRGRDFGDTCFLYGLIRKIHRPTTDKDTTSDIATQALKIDLFIYFFFFIIS